MGIYGRECCNLQTAALKTARFCKLAIDSGREFHCTIASGKLNIYSYPFGVTLLKGHGIAVPGNSIRVLHIVWKGYSN